jgi:hypothetical protein
MNTITLIPKIGFANPVGNGTVTFTSPTAPAVAPGDMWVLNLSGQSPNHADVGYMMPWETTPTYAGVTDAEGNLMIFGSCGSPGEHQITDGVGIVLAANVLPDGVQSPFGPRVCQFTVAGATPPVPVPGIALLVSTVEASAQTRVPVADWRTQSVGVQFIAFPPYTPSPSMVTIWAGECLNLPASTNIAELIGGVVVPVTPPAEFVMFAQAPLPVVNGIRFVNNGVPMTAVAGEVAQAFDQPAANLQAAILACFTAVPTPATVMAPVPAQKV